MTELHSWQLRERAFAAQHKNARTGKDDLHMADTAMLAQIGELGTKLDSINKAAADFGARIGNLEKRAAREPDNDNYSPGQSLARKLVNSPAFAALNGGRARGRAQVEMATITSANTTVGAGRSQGTSLVPAHRLPGIVTPPQRVMTVRDLLAPGRTDSNNIEFVKETGFTNNAAPVAEGATKPYSDLTFDMVNAPVRTIAHLFKISRQMMDDAPALISHIDTRGHYGLALKEESQLLRGDGTGQNILGLIPQSTAFAPAFVPQDATRIDRLRLAILQVRKAEYRASGIVVSPDDLAQLELTKDSTGRYLMVNVIEGGQSKVWKLPIVDSSAMNPGEFLVGAFDVAGQIFDRWEPSMLISTENADDFEKNMASVLIEQRLAMAVYRPESFVYGTFE